MSSPASVTYDSDKAARHVFERLRTIAQRRELLRLLTQREITSRYKRSVLGVWWTLLNPMVTALILWMVFSQIFDRAGGGGVPYIVFMLSGILFMQLFAQGLTGAAGAIQQARFILLKVPVPAELFAFSAAGASFVNFAAAMTGFFLIMFGSGVPPTLYTLLAVVPVLLILILVIGLGLIIAVGAVRFYDLLDFVRVLTTLAVWTVPTFYPLSIVPEHLRPYFRMNPLFRYLDSFRMLLYEGTMPPNSHWAIMVICSSLAFYFGIRMFIRAWKNLAVML